jgi:integrase/recombinase XerD
MDSQDGYKRNIEKILANSRISQANRDILKNYDTYGKLQQLTLGTRTMRLINLQQLALFINKDFKAMIKADIENYFSSIGELKHKTLTVKGAFVKSFFKWLFNSDEYPPNVRWIKTSAKSIDNKLPEDLLTKDEINSMVEATDNLRDKVLILMLYESACRIGEIANLRLKDIVFDEYGAAIVVNGKTGMRRLRLIECALDLSQWVNNHPNNDDRNAHLFMSFSSKNFGEGLHIAALGKIVRNLAKKANINKKVHPHLFRHTRLTELAKDFTESELKVIAGWTGSSRMAGVYVHLSGGDIEKKMLEKHGLIGNKDPATEPHNPISNIEILKNNGNGGNGNTGAIVVDPLTLQLVISGVIQEVMNNLFKNDLSPMNGDKRIQDSIKIGCQ